MMNRDSKFISREMFSLTFCLHPPKKSNIQTLCSQTLLEGRAAQLGKSSNNEEVGDTQRARQKSGKRRGVDRKSGIRRELDRKSVTRRGVDRKSKKRSGIDRK